MTTEGLRAATDKMRAAGVPELAVRVFSTFHDQLRSNATGTIPEGTIEPLTDVAHLDDVRPDQEAVARALGQTVVIKFTGTEDVSLQTSFVLDDVTLTVQ